MAVALIWRQLLLASPIKHSAVYGTSPATRVAVRRMPVYSSACPQAQAVAAEWADARLWHQSLKTPPSVHRLALSCTDGITRICIFSRHHGWPSAQPAAISKHCGELHLTALLALAYCLFLNSYCLLHKNYHTSTFKL